MKKVILTVGAPGSGKSTWAKEQVKRSKLNDRVIIICRDDLRSMMFGEEYKYSRVNELQVTTALKDILEKSFDDDTISEVIIADTNLSEGTRTGLIKIVETRNQQIVNSGLKKPNISIELVTFDVPWTTLVQRNNKRGIKAVPIDVLRSMYKNMQKYLGKHSEYVPDTSKPKAIIVDLDGTIANNDHRNAFEYHKIPNDKPIEKIVDLVKMYSDFGHDIICVSGRNAGNKEDHKKFHRLTKQWLDDNNIPWYSLHMRDWNDYRKDDIVKEEIFWEKIADKYNVVLALDDRSQVVEMWRRIGVTCLQVAHGDF